MFSPSQILIVDSSADPKSKLFSIIEDNLIDLNSNLMILSRRYWAEILGLELIQQLAFVQELESIKIAISGNYFAICCFAAVIKYIELSLTKTFPMHSLRIRYEVSEGSMMIDLSTIHALELNQNLRNPRSKDCLFGLLSNTLTPMGARLLRSNILQPLTDAQTLNTRYDALEELTSKEDMFFGVRGALKSVPDVDKILTALIVIPTQASLQYTEQAINNVISLKQFVKGINSIFEALVGARSSMLCEIQRLCAPENVEPVLQLIDSTINDDITYASKPIDLRNQRTYAVRSGLNGLLDVARQTYKEGNEDIYEYVETLAREYNMDLQAMYDNKRMFYIRLPAADLEGRNLPPDVFKNVFRNKSNIEMQTLQLMKWNQRISDSHTEVLLMSDNAVQNLTSEIRQHISVLFKISEAIAMLDMLGAFAHIVTLEEYVRPRITNTLGIQAARHPIKERIQTGKYVPNDVYATQQNRFQIITGCNMSGKSTYIRCIALMCVMAQIGSFVPARFASITIIKQLFARVSIDDSVEANVSTFASEMRETAFILNNVDKDSLVIIDELGRGTGTRDGLAIALAIAEALVGSRALVWFATHFRELAHIMSERNGVVNKHLAVDMRDVNSMTMLYKLTDGIVIEEHYGLQLARVLPFPADVLEYATLVANKLRERLERQKASSMAIVHARRRKLILSLKEELLQAQQGIMEGEVLSSWLDRLQREFVVRMMAIDEEVRRAACDSETGEEASSMGGGDNSMLTMDTAEDEQMADAASRSDSGSLVQVMESIEYM
ncbi:hypothetical protein AAFC00_003705 [Neodothiora populina]